MTLTALPMVAAAQFTFNANTDPGNAPKNEIGGVPAFDLIHLDGLGPAIPLRKGNVVAGSERVQLDSQVLKAGTDYGMDYVSGVVYLKRALKPGMSLTVFYRYDGKAAPPPPARISGVNGFNKLELLPGQLGVIAGMGMAERGQDGSVTTSNVFGFNSNFAAGSSKLNGLFLFSQKKKVSAEQLMGYQGAQNAQQMGNSNLLVENLQTSIGKGSFQASYQDVSKNFTDFGSALAAGYDAKVVDQLAKEKGLKRMGFGFNNVDVGGMTISQSFKMVGQGDKQIDWRSFGLKQGGFAFNYASQHVGKGFTRFNDLAEADRAQLAKEVGMDRQSIGADFAEKFGKLSFTDNTINDGAGSAIDRKELKLDTSKIAFRLVDQKVAKTFSRIGSILPAEQAMFGAELGVRRQMMSLDANLGKEMQPVHFAMTDLSAKSGDFKSTDFSASGKTWSLEHSSRETEAGFTSFGALNAEADNHVKAIANMYQKDGIALRPQDKQIFLSTPGISREFTRFTLSPFNGFGINAQRLEISNHNSNSTIDTLSLTSKRINFNYRKEDLGIGLDPNSLLLFERDRLGMVAGLNRTDMSLTMDMGGAKTLAITKTDASVGDQEMDRGTLAYKDKKIDVQAGMRNVSPGFALVNQLVDPEKDFLRALTGFRERDVKVVWQLLPNLKLEGYSFDASSDTASQEKRLRNLLIDWKPDKNTSFNYTHYENHSDDPTQILFANVLDRMSFFHDFGKLGKIAYTREKQSFDGSQTQQPDSEKQMFAYEAKLDNRTSVRTEETTTQYDNGDKEQTSANTISTTISKQLGVSVSDVKIDRPGADHDEKKRNYGFWLDFGHGIRFNYGYARQLNGNFGAMQEASTLTGGQIGEWKVGDSGYSVNTWDKDNRTQASTKFALGTVKPIRLGFLKDVNVNVGWDTASDRSLWIRENKAVSFGARLGSNQIGFDYRSQIAQNQQRGIDRVFTLKTDPAEKQWLRGSMYYKARTMPDGKQIMIRNMSVTARLMKGVEITNTLLTNPEQPNANVLLGSVPLADRKNSWRLDYKPVTKADSYKTQYAFGATWDELINDQNKTLTRTGGATFRVNFANAKAVKADDPLHSSLALFYGLEQNDTTSRRRLAQRYSLQYDQRPGENQILSFMVGNVSYEHSIADGFHRDNWTVRLDYQFKF